MTTPDDLREQLRALWEKHDAHPVGAARKPRWRETGRISDLVSDVEALVREQVEAAERYAKPTEQTPESS